MVAKKSALHYSAMWLVIVVVGGGLLALRVYDEVTDPALAGETNCPTNLRTPIASHWVVLVDTTDPYSPNQKRRLRQQFAELRQDIPRYGLLSLYLINEAATIEPEAKVSLCNPGRAAQGWLEYLSSHPVVVYQDWETKFDVPFEDALGEEGAVLDETSRVSPILERIPFVSNDAFGGSKSSIEDKRLYLVSDLVQHSSSYSHYEDRILDWESFRKRRDFATLTASPGMDGVRVEVLYMLRPCGNELDIQSNSEHIMWWERFSIDVGVSDLRVEPVAGSDMRCGSS